MKILHGFCVICSVWITGNVALANQPVKEDKTNLGHQAEKPSLKISERRSLKKPDIESASVSNFSMEELRVGAQRILDRSEIQYFKSQCRYAFMSDRDVIVNRCEARKVSTQK